MGDTPQLWKAHEVDIVLDFFVGLKRTSGEEALHKVSHETMEDICRHLRKKGYFRTVNQVKSKWKSLKKRYNAALTDGNREEWDYFDRMHDIFSSSENLDETASGVENGECEEAGAENDTQDDVLAVVKAFVEHYENRDKQFLKEMRKINEDFLREQQRQQQEFLSKLQNTVDNVIHNFTANVLSKIGEVVVKSWAENVLQS